MLEFIQHYWIEFGFSIIIAILTAGYRNIKQELRQKMIEQIAVKNGIVALLRQSLVDSYNKYSEKGYCPIYAKEVAEQIYKQYTALGGNDIGSELYHKIVSMPTNKKSKEEN